MRLPFLYILRLPKSQNAWEQRKLGDIGSFRSGVGFLESEQGGMAGIPFYKVSDMNLSENNIVMNISSNYVTDDQISRNKWKPIDGNTIIFAKVGAAVFLERKRQTRCKFLIDNNMMSYKPNSIQDHDYIYYTFQNLNLSHYAQIGSLPSLNAGELKNVNIVLPDQNEQSKVSQLFLNLDRTITLHEEKQRQLERLKKALLQKMFADETGYPALRFKGFTEKWEQVEFGKLGIISRGLTYRPNDVTDKNGVRVLRSSNIYEDSFVLNDNDVFVNSSVVNVPNLKNGDILVTSANGSSRLVGKHAIVKGLSSKTVHGGFMLAIRPATNSYFLNSLMSTSWYDNFISAFVSGGNGSIGNLKKSDLEQQSIFIPLEMSI